MYSLALVGMKYHSELIEDLMYFSYDYEHRTYHFVCKSKDFYISDIENVTFLMMNLYVFNTVECSMHELYTFKSEKSVYGVAKDDESYVGYPKDLLKFFVSSLKIRELGDGISLAIERYRIHSFCWDLNNLKTWTFKGNCVFLKDDRLSYGAELLVDAKIFDEELLFRKMVY